VAGRSGEFMNNPFEKALEKLGPGGEYWIKGRSMDDEGNICLEEAVWEACQDVSARSYCAALAHLRPIVAERFPGRCPGLGKHVNPFNDHPDTTWEDVALVLKEAAQQWTP
jgi:hypothetical protein